MSNWDNETWDRAWSMAACLKDTAVEVARTTTGIERFETLQGVRSAAVTLQISILNEEQVGSQLFEDATKMIDEASAFISGILAAAVHNIDMSQ